VSTKTLNANDFDSLTALYREIFSLLTKTRTGDEYEGETRRKVEREVAAAVESVFPRIGLKSFVQLSTEEKKNQLNELANIVLGIRLFNKEIGKGGAGLHNIETEAVQRVDEIGDIIGHEVQTVNEMCSQYQEAIVYSNLSKPIEVTEFMIARWKDELANRRQYLSYLQSLLEDISLCSRRIHSLRENFLNEIDDLRSIVGSRNSVPKEHVYPKFDKIAQLWLNLCSESEVVETRESTLNDLAQYKSTFTPTLNSDSGVLKKAKEAPVPSSEEEAKAAVAAIKIATEGSTGSNAGAAESKSSEGGEEKKSEKGEGVPADLLPEGERPQRLSVHSTPEFMQLPLEYQGFCCYTILKKGGLLLPGKPNLGVVQYKNAFYVFTHELALQSFLDDPVQYVEGVKETAMKSPELIHLLRLQNVFPNAAISKLIGGDVTSEVDDSVTMGFDAPAEKKDVSTETPLHFVEKHIDPSYDWNEWGLRRRALQIATLRKCKTTSQQTDNSHMRRENETQVYLPRTKETMTKKDSGTSVPVKVSYITGIRGETKPSAYAKGGGNKAGIVQMEFELEGSSNNNRK